MWLCGNCQSDHCASAAESVRPIALACVVVSAFAGGSTKMAWLRHRILLYCEIFSSLWRSGWFACSQIPLCTIVHHTSMSSPGPGIHAVFCSCYICAYDVIAVSGPKLPGHISTVAAPVYISTVPVPGCINFRSLDNNEAD